MRQVTASIVHAQDVYKRQGNVFTGTSIGSTREVISEIVFNLSLIHISEQTNVDTIANNLSNVNTTGFKGQRTEFKSLLYQTIQTLSLIHISDEIEEITGILNGTTNYMLTKMTEEGADFDEVLKDAQDMP